MYENYNEMIMFWLPTDFPSEGSTLHDVDLDGSYNEDCRGKECYNIYIIYNC